MQASVHVGSHDGHTSPGEVAVLERKSSVQADLTSGLQGGSLRANQNILEVELDVVLNSWHLSLERIKSAVGERASNVEWVPSNSRKVCVLVCVRIYIIVDLRSALLHWNRGVFSAESRE